MTYDFKATGKTNAMQTPIRRHLGQERAHHASRCHHGTSARLTDARRVTLPTNTGTVYLNRSARCGLTMLADASMVRAPAWQTPDESRTSLHPPPHNHLAGARQQTCATSSPRSARHGRLAMADASATAGPSNRQVRGHLGCVQLRLHDASTAAGSHQPQPGRLSTGGFQAPTSPGD